MDNGNPTRRTFVKTTALSAAALAAMGTNFAHAAGTDKITVGVIGCGGRGTGAAKNACEAADNVEIVALGDVFQDRIDGAKKGLADLKDKFKVTDDRCFVGFDAYEKVLATDCNYVILATPPGFRPAHFKAAVAAGKHVFMEKPVAVDPVGARVVLACGEVAKEKGLGVVAGTQRRHQQSYVETMKRIQDGAIGEIVAAEGFWNQGALWMHPRKPEWSDMEWQLRNWLYFTWLSGDHIVEQHLHQLDVMHWLFGGPPKTAYGTGGRQVRTSPDYGHIYDHFAIEFVYPSGARVLSMCRQQEGTEARVSEFAVGTKGTSNCANWIKGASEWKHEGKGPNAYVQEHADLIASIRAGKPLNESKQVAEATITAIMGRMAAYTGKQVTLEDVMKSEMNLSPAKLEMGPLPVPPVAVPGRDKLT